MTGCIIGSFRKYYQDIVEIINKFEEAGITILSPKVSSIINPGEEFVILASDDANLTNEQIQAKVFENERNSDFVYVWDPDGYTGRTTCYEIGRIIEQKNKPIFYKERPIDIPITIEEQDIMDIEEVIEKVLSDKSIGQNKRKENVIVGFTLEEKSLIEKKAAKEGKSVEVFIRDLLLAM